jgi:hypothetical protein
MTHSRRILAFSDKEVALLDRALAIAWGRLLRAGMMDDYDIVEAQQILAQRIFGSAAEGELDPWRLAREALFHFWEIKFTGKPLIKLAAPKDVRASSRAQL